MKNQFTLYEQCCERIAGFPANQPYSFHADSYLGKNQRLHRFRLLASRHHRRGSWAQQRLSLLRRVHGHSIRALSRAQSYQVTPATQDILGGQRHLPALLLLRNWCNSSYRRQLVCLPHLRMLAKELGCSVDESVGFRSYDQCFCVLLRDSIMGLHRANFTVDAVC